MLNPLFRRLQRYQKIIKFLLAIGLLTVAAILVFMTSPGTWTTIGFLVLVFGGVFLIGNSFWPGKYATIVAFTVVFFLSLRGLKLLNPINIGLYLLFLILLASYLKKGKTAV